jgi:hypothetical protein
MSREDDIPCETPKEDLMNHALKHYEEISSKAVHSLSDIPKAIKFYYEMKDDTQKLSFEELKESILKSNAKSEYKQASIIIIRRIFKDLNTGK